MAYRTRDNEVGREGTAAVAALWTDPFPTSTPGGPGAPQCRDARNAELLRHVDMLRRYARRLSGDRAMADDLVQETIARGLAHWHQWRGEGRRSTWLASIMRNLFREIYRRRAREVSVADVEDALGANGATDTTAIGDMAIDIDRALAALSPPHAEIIRLIAVDGLTYAEAAARTALPIGTVMSRMSRARANLLRVIDPPV